MRYSLTQKDLKNTWRDSPEPKKPSHQQAQKALSEALKQEKKDV